MKQIATILILITTLQASAQKSLNVLDWKPETTLNNYLVRQMHDQYDQRRKRFDVALQSAKNMHAYIRECSDKYLQILGSLPLPVIDGRIYPGQFGIRSPLKAITIPVWQRGQGYGVRYIDDTSTRSIMPPVTKGYTIEKLIYESTPDHKVSANLYIPKGKGPFPAVLLFCGHEDAGKATESYQQTAMLFAKNGYVVLVIDPVSQAERYQLLDANRKPLTRGGTTEHTLLNEASNLLGESTPKDELWDNVRGLDYLVTRSEVDTSRIGCLGNSGGGMQTIYFAGFDPRIKVMAPCSYVATRERTLEMTGPADGCAQMPGEGKGQLEFADYLLMAAPKPLLILAGRYDFIDYRGTQEAYYELKKAYTVLGKPDQVELFSVDDGHGISQPKREAAVRWFNRWLKGDDRPVYEGQDTVMTITQLQATLTGQVAASFDKNLVTRNQDLYQWLHMSRVMFLKQRPQEINGSIAQVSGLSNSDRKVVVEGKGVTEMNGFVFQKRIIRKNNEPPLPALVLCPEGSPKQVIVWANDSGKTKSAAQAEQLHKLLHEGSLVILCDLRGTGETEDKAEFNDPKYYNKEYRNAMLALHVGRPLVGQRATDILSVIDLLATDPATSRLPVTVMASGINVLPALHAALFGNFRVELKGGIRSWKEVLDRPTDRDWYSYVIPGALKYYDIADLLTLLGDRVHWLN